MRARWPTGTRIEVEACAAEVNNFLKAGAAVLSCFPVFKATLASRGGQWMSNPEGRPQGPRHSLEWDPRRRRWVCQACWVPFLRRARGEQRGCKPVGQAPPLVQRAAANGHRLWVCQAGGSLASLCFCSRCGLYAESQWRGLLGRCPGPPGTVGGRATSKRRLMQRLHPTTREPLGFARRLGV